MNKCFTILLLIGLNTQIYSQWESTILPTNGYDIGSVKFFNPDTGLAAASGGGVLKTTDGGNNWHQSTLPINQWPDKLDIIGNNVAYAVGYPNYNIKSTDGGENWFTINETYFNEDWVLNNLDFIDDNIGWITGARNDTFMVSKTSDGGSSWETKYLQSPLSLFAGRGLNFLNQNLGWVSISRDSIIKTTNGGDNWSTIYLGVTALTNQIFFYNASHGWIIGNGGKILSSQDGGNTWIEQTQLLNSQLFSVFFASTTKGWAVGSDYSGTSIIGIIMYTDDGGSNWNLQFEYNMGLNNHLYSIFFVNEYIGWAGGIGGVLLKTTTGGVTSISSDFINENSFLLQQNYPNPFNPSTTIKFSIPHSQFVTLKVYDLLGREVTTLVNEEKLPGNYEVKFDGGNLSNGVYFYRLKAGDYMFVKKFILMK